MLFVCWSGMTYCGLDRQIQGGAMKCRLLLALLVLMLAASPPASAEMFGSGYKPCGEKSSTMEVVACV